MAQCFDLFSGGIRRLLRCKQLGEVPNLDDTIFICCGNYVSLRVAELGLRQGRALRLVTKDLISLNSSGVISVLMNLSDYHFTVCAARDQ